MIAGQIDAVTIITPTQQLTVLNLRDQLPLRGGMTTFAHYG